jgi:hypothetical protein
MFSIPELCRRRNRGTSQQPRASVRWDHLVHNHFHYIGIQAADSPEVQTAFAAPAAPSIRSMDLIPSR